MNGRKILGLIEPIVVRGNHGTEEKVIARIDTGATSSSIDITLAGTLELGPVLRSKVVKSASAIGQRPLVHAVVVIGDKVMEEEFTVADRSHMTYKILIGQNILKKGHFLVDPLKKVKQ